MENSKTIAIDLDTLYKEQLWKIKSLLKIGLLVKS